MRVHAWVSILYCPLASFSPPVELPTRLAEGKKSKLKNNKAYSKDTAGLPAERSELWSWLQLPWLGAGVFLTQQHPAESPSISSGKHDCLNTLPLRQHTFKSLWYLWTSCLLSIVVLFPYLSRKRMFVKTQGSFWRDFGKETLFLWSESQTLTQRS